MQLVSVEELSTYSSRFDIFVDSTEVNPRLLSAGLISPLPVCGPELVWGFSVLKASVAAGIDAVYCTEGVFSAGDKLLLALALENRTGLYNLEEQTAIAGLAEQIELGEELEAVSLAVVGNNGLFPRIKQYTSLPSHLRQYVNAGRLDLKTAVRVVGLPEAVCRAACEHTGFSHSELRIFLGFLYEIDMRDSIGPSGLTRLAEDLIETINPVASIRRIRNPERSELERRLRDVWQEHLVGTGLTLNPPKFFEGDMYQVTFPFANGAELKKRNEILRGLEAASDELEDLL